MLLNKNPRIVIGGLAGDSGKTMVSCGLLSGFRRMGMNSTGFKKGPDYIDSAWLRLSSGRPARNLDTYLMGFKTVKNSFIKNSVNSDISIVEGNRGLFDGFDSKGTHSTAELAKLLQSPVIIVQDISKVTTTAAASILGCINFDPDLKIAGVILNQVAGKRHGTVASAAIEEMTGIPVFGKIPKLSGKYVLPSRHLGLITPDEFDDHTVIIEDIRKIICDNVDVQRILKISKQFPINSDKNFTENESVVERTDEKVKIGYFKDRSFSFYYPENLEMLRHRGAEVIPISSVDDTNLHDIDTLYIGGGFPETNLENLSANKQLQSALKEKVEDGLPVYAECGGLIYLSEAIQSKGSTYQLSGILPVKIIMSDKPKGHGYYEAIVDDENPFYENGTILKGHEFHYSWITDYDPEIKSSLFVKRGTGCFNKRDGIQYKNVFASYLHVHTLATPEWADGMIRSAIGYKNIKKTKILIER